MRNVHRVVVLAADGVYPFDLGIPNRVFGAAGGRYEVVTCTADGRPVRTNADFSITVEHGPEALRTADTVIIPPFHIPDREAPATVAQALAFVSPAARIVSICTGAFVLAAAGLLDGRPATTHWKYADEFDRLYPEVDLDEAVLFTDDGDLLTSAGLSAGVDLCLHLIRRDHGSEVATRVARRSVVAPWREGGQSQFIERPVPEEGDNGTAETREWAVEHLAEPLTLADLAEHARMSVRTFTRRFREETGISPLRWLAAQRIALARQLLESTDATVDRVAAEAGFGTPASLRQHLRAAIGVAPLAYRRTFRGVGVTGHSPSLGMLPRSGLVR